MDLFKGILVQVISNGEILKSYNDPDSSENENPYQRQEYIEAVTGATFAIKVLITDQFDLRNISRKDGMIVDLIVDGLDWRHGYYFTREEIEDDWGTGKPHICDFDEFTHFSDKTGQWMKSEYSFNALKLDESSSVDFLPARVQELGKIEISLQRVKLRPCGPERDKMIPVKTITEVSERALKGKAVESNVKPTEGVPVEPPDPQDKAEFFPISGSKGVPLVHNILYRSKRALQMIGCIPPESSSPAITILDNEEQDSASRAASINANSVGPHDLQQQVQSLRAQLALLERTLNVKSESPNADIQATSGPRNIKREREDEEDTAPRQRRRILAKVETIDLTDD